MNLIENLKVRNVLSKEYASKLMKLNIQLFGSSLGSGSNSTYLYSNTYPSKYPYTLAVSWKENSYSVSGNTSSVTVSASFTADQNWWETSHQSTLAIYWYDNYTGTEKQVGYLNFAGLSGKYDSKSTSATFTVTHKSDGKLSGYAKAVFTKGNTTTGYACNSGSVATSTSELYNIPRQANIKTAPDFNDEENPTITYENSAGSAVTSLQACISLTGSNDDIEYRDINKTGTLSYTFKLTDEERKLLRTNTPSNSRKLFFYVRTIIGGNTYYSKLEKTFTIINADPDFNDFEFEDINETTVALTGSNQDVVLGYSNVKVTIPVANKAVALKEATMVSYRFNNISANYSDTEDVSITSEKVTSGEFTVYAIDSRSNSKPKTKSAVNVINYTPLTKGNISATRKNGVSESVVLNFSGIINLVNFGAVENSIKTAKYRYTIAGKENWSTYADLQLTIDENGNFSFNDLISGDIKNVGFDINNSYNIEVVIEDELSNITYSTTLGSGIPHIAYAKNGVGIMGKYDESVGGLLQVGGKSITSNKILNTYSESETDVYSCDYVNKTNSAITAYLTGESDYTTDERGSFSNTVISGNGLSLVGNAIIVGKGVSKVRISANFNVQTGSGTSAFILNLYIRKNGSIIMKNNDYKYNVPEWNYSSMANPPFLIEVQKGDKITLGLSSTRNVRIHNDKYGKSYLTVEVVE